MNGVRIKGKRADVVFGILPAVILLNFFGVLGVVWDLFVALDSFQKLGDGQSFWLSSRGAARQR